VATHEQQLASGADAVRTVPRGARAMWDTIAGQDTVAQLWSCVFAQRRLDEAPEREYALEIPELLDNSIEGQLKRFQLQLERGNKTVTNKHQLLSQVPWRLFLANVASLYLKETDEGTRKRVRRDSWDLNTTEKRRPTVFATFVDYLLPVLRTDRTVTRQAAERKFDRWVQYGKRWAKLVQPYGPAILLLIPYGLTNER
jgi:hypothetical protein